MVNQIDAVFSALADPNRRRVVQLLGSAPMRASELATATGMARNAMSRHLGILRESGLVEVEFSNADARARLYRLQANRLAEVGDWIATIESDWRDQLERFKRFAEANTRVGDDS